MTKLIAFSSAEIRNESGRADLPRRPARSWCTAPSRRSDDDVTRSTIAISDEQIDDLRDRLHSDALPRAGDRRRLVAGRAAGLRAGAVATYWADDYDWRAREARLNRFPQFTTHARRSQHPLHPRALAARQRAAVADDPRLAGLGRRVHEGHRAADQSRPTRPTRSTSCARRCPATGGRDKPSTTGWGTQHIARAWTHLMARSVTTATSRKAATGAAAVTTGIGAIDAGPLRRDPPQHDHRPAGQGHAAPTSPTPSRRRSPTTATTRQWGTGYSKQQSTRPQTLGYALVDSPVGPDGVDRREVLAVDRLRRPPRERADPRRDARQRDALLAAGQRRVVGPAVLGELQRPRVRQGASCRRACRCSRKRSSVRRVAGPSRTTTSRYWNELDKGGHFAAFEQPELFVNELRAAFRQFR